MGGVIEILCQSVNVYGKRIETWQRNFGTPKISGPVKLLGDEMILDFQNDRFSARQPDSTDHPNADWDFPSSSE